MTVDFASFASNVSFDLGAGPVELIHPGLAFQWLFHGRCFSFSADHTSRSLVDAWAEKIHSIVKNYSPGRASFSVNDFSGKDCATTPYNRQKNTEILRTYPHIQSYSALIMQRSASMQLAKFFIRTVPARNMHADIFFTYPEALNWIKRQIDSHMTTPEAQEQTQQKLPTDGRK